MIIALIAVTPLASFSSSAKANDIVDVAASKDQFSTLVAAIKAAGPVDTLKSDGPFTVFAPTNDAFAALPEGSVENLLKAKIKEQLIAVLTYHVVPRKVMSGDIAGKTSAVKTVQGSEILIDATAGVRVDDASVTAADIVTSNGVIHVIDKVVLPN